MQLFAFCEVLTKFFVSCLTGFYKLLVYWQRYNILAAVYLKNHENNSEPIHLPAGAFYVPASMLRIFKDSEEPTC